jgi:mono/diheme cytochrome c family protein
MPMLTRVAVLIAAGIVAKAELPLERAPSKTRTLANPYAGQERARKAGEKLFRHECAECHGSNAAGEGKAPPLNLPIVTNAQPGAIFWVLRNGSLYRGMPSFAALPEQQRWQIVTYLQTLVNH